MFYNIVFGLTIVVTPWICHELIKRMPWLNALGSVALCYIFGMIYCNVLPFNTIVAKEISEIAVPLSIPLLLLSTDFLKFLKLSKMTIFSFLLQILSVISVTLFVGLFFQTRLPEYNKIAAMLSGVYIGGTPNMSALKMALNVSHETFILLNASDILVSSLYFLILIGPLKHILNKFLPAYYKKGLIDENELKYPWEEKAFLYIAKNLFYSLFVLGISFFLAKQISDSMFVAVIIFSITTLAILGSFLNPLKTRLHGAYDIGSYILLIFCVSIGAQAKPSSIFNGSLDFVYFTFFSLFGSVILHYLFCFYFKIDRDTAMVTSTAGIFGPAFIGPVANSLDNKEIVVAGITTGLVGYALGNYLGILVFYLLSFF